MLLGFVVRMFFVRHLAVELLGINGVFTSIFAIFSLAELGFATAVSYALYKPLAENNQNKVAVLMRYLKKAYIFIGCVILIVGLVLLPFLQFIVNGYQEIGVGLGELRVYYLIFLFTTVFPYFISYKRTLIIADQKKYIADSVVMLVTIVARISQIVVIIVLKNFVIYLSIGLALVLVEQIIINFIVGRKYPYIKSHMDEKLSKKEKKNLFSNIGALSVARAGSVFTSGIIPIIILAFIGLREVGLYSNYLLVTGSATVILALIITSATASVGNFAATRSKPEQKKLFDKILYFIAFFGALSLAGLLLLLNDFIVIWLRREDMVLGGLVALFMSVDVFLWIMRSASSIIYQVHGLYKHFFYRTSLEIAIFIGLAIPGAIFFGITGIMVAKIIAQLIAQIPFEVYVISKYGLDDNPINYCTSLAKYTIITLAAVGLSYLAIFAVPLAGLLGFLVKVTIVATVVVLTYVGFTFRSEEFKYFKSKIKLKRKVK